MNFSDIAAIRLANQHVSKTPFSTPKKLLKWMGAMQAQDYRMVQWAMGVRLPGSTLRTIEAAIAQGEIIRTHILRPTWHFVAADDLRWMLELTAPRVKVAMRSRHKYLGLTEEVITKSNNIIEAVLVKSESLTRDKLVSKLEAAGFENKNNLASHLLLRAELDGVICSGPSQGTAYTYALLDERIPKTDTLSKEEALAKLAHIYFRSHGPATLKGFSWWSGLTKTSARKGLEMIKGDFTCETIDSTTYWFSNSNSPVKTTESAYLLPAYDEFLIGYRERGAVMPENHYKKAVSANGIFRPIIVVNEQIVGIWRRSQQKETILIQTAFFEDPSDKTKYQVEEAASKYASFLDKELEIQHALH